MSECIQHAKGGVGPRASKRRLFQSLIEIHIFLWLCSFSGLLTKKEKPKKNPQRWFRTDCLTTETLLRENAVKPVEKSPCVLEEKDKCGRSCWKPSYQNLNWSIIMWHNLTHSHTKTMVCFPGLHTRSKPETTGQKTGPCHSLLGVNLLCPQSCFLLSPLNLLYLVLIADWIWSSQHLAVFQKISRFPSTTQQADQQITLDTFSKGATSWLQNNNYDYSSYFSYSFAS